MAAVDYARLQARLPRARLLFVAHREEILAAEPGHVRTRAARWQNSASCGSAATDRSVFDHVFASIQSLNASGVEAIDRLAISTSSSSTSSTTPRRRRTSSFSTRLQPVELLGLTATPERSDGLPILHWFGDRIAAELRLWDAIDQHRLVPFSYFGVADKLGSARHPVASWQRIRR